MACRSHTCTSGGCVDCFVSRRILQNELQDLFKRWSRRSPGRQCPAAGLQPRAEDHAPRLGCRVPHVGEAPHEQGSAIPVRWSYTCELARVLSGMLGVPCEVGLSPVSTLERRCPRQAVPRSPGRCRAPRYISGGARPMPPEPSRGRASS